jgi:hypothetical protein
MKLLSLLLQTVTIACVSAFVPRSTSSKTIHRFTMSADDSVWRDDNIVTLVPSLRSRMGARKNTWKAYQSSLS